MHKIAFLALGRRSKLSEIEPIRAVTDAMLQTFVQTLNHVVATAASDAAPDRWAVLKVDVFLSCR